MASSSTRKRKRTDSNSRSVPSSSPMYDVEKILKYRQIDSNNNDSFIPIQILIKWSGYDEPTWEPIENFTYNLVFIEYVESKFRDMETKIDATVADIKGKSSYLERVAETFSHKAKAMLEMMPFDPFEYKIMQVFFHLDEPNEKFRKIFEEHVFKNYFFKLDQLQQNKNDELLEKIREKEDIKVTIENDENFDNPPEFQYIVKNILPQLVTEENVLENKSIDGCSCTVQETVESCGKDSQCCPKLCKKPFMYKKDNKGMTILRLLKGIEIIECGDICACGADCINRLTQQRKTVDLCLFMTKDRGWGLKTINDVSKGTYIIEYVGELIGEDEANQRTETTYLFDLNEGIVADNRFHTIDANVNGNLSRFINHSCEPNSKVLYINNCQKNPKNLKLCFFANKLIPKDTEITLDYRDGEIIPERAGIPALLPICTCGSENCRKVIY